MLSRQISKSNSLFQTIQGDYGEVDPNNMLESPTLNETAPKTSKLLPAFLKVLKKKGTELEDKKVKFDEVKSISEDILSIPLF